MALGQLEHLDELFVKSGWLARQCDTFNEDNAQAILAGEIKFPQAPNLYALDTYVVTPMSKPGPCAARDQDANRSIPWAVLQSSFSELLNPRGLLVHIFVSHFWGHLYSSTLTALRFWATKHFSNFAQHPQSAVFWICLFALNQHAVADEVGEKPMQGPFNAALAQATGGAVMVLDQSVNPFKRIWCLFEVSYRRATRFASALLESWSWASHWFVLFGQDGFGIEIAGFPEGKAQSSKEADKFSIWLEVADSGLRQGICGSGAERFFRQATTEHGIDYLDSTCFAAFNRHMRSLLSTSLLQNVLASSDFRSAARCCAHGACFNEEQLEKLWANFESDKDRGDWLGQMLIQTTWTGNASLLHLLLKLGADARYTLGGHHMTSLLGLGARFGHESVVGLLLELGADASAADNDNDGLTALMHAARSGHESVVRLLLELGADASAATNDGVTEKDGVTVLMRAAIGGHEAVVKRLLEHGADAREKDSEGETALMLAAQSGHDSAVKLLLENGADAAAATQLGVTALMLAAAHGHESVVKLLLENGADAMSASNYGLTAQVAAARGGHGRVAELLAQHLYDTAPNDEMASLALLSQLFVDCSAATTTS
ncbi:ANKRD50 [Symbiodinium microadriaticum]|nr:ANKRD50 [Symbiodinium microadriaticum]